MGWPKTDEGLRLYYEQKNKTFLLVDPDARNSQGCYEAVGEVLVDNDPMSPMLASTSVSPVYLYRKTRRVSWDQLPPIWKRAFSSWIDGSPRKFRGLWRL